MTQYKYNSADLVKPVELTEREEFLLKDSKTFCIYPWIHLHAYPTGEAYPCCHAEMAYPVGNTKFKTLEDIYRDAPMRELRKDMLAERPNPACGRCYEQEESGFFSGRKSANKHHGHHIKRIDDDKFQMSYWDIRFSNLCNLSCRSCGHIFSSSWYQDQAKLAGGTWREQNVALNYAGRTETDMWEQLIPHLDYVEQIYFAGGEPLMMAEHYNILDELERRGRFDVRLIYNTNFTQTKLKDRVVFDYWRKFKSVAVGASLDAMGPRAEYIRRGTDWDQVERNRELMLEICPDVDFYISPTLSILNAWHLPDFHRSWVNKGYIRPQDLNVNILQDPTYLRIDIAPGNYKKCIRTKYEEHLEWLRPLDKLQRATVGFESAINFMRATDNNHLIEKFWNKTNELDAIRKENVLDVIPELHLLKRLTLDNYFDQTITWQPRQNNQSHDWIAVGCSHTAGIGVFPSEIYVNRLSEHYKRPVHNLAIGGGNSTVCRHNIMQWLEQSNRPELIIAQWPNPIRSTVWNNDQPMLLTISDDHALINTKLRLGEENFYSTWLDDIVTVNRICDLLGIKIVNIMLESLDPKYHKILQSKNINLYTDNAQSGESWMFDNNGDDKIHHSATCHQAWAQRLIGIIDEYTAR